MAVAEMVPMLPGDNLRTFAEYVRRAPADPAAERFVREMLGRVSASCPVPVLVQLAECLIGCRRAELGREAERN